MDTVQTHGPHVNTYGGSFRDRLAHYTHRDAPHMLRLLLGIAESSRRPVAIEYFETPRCGEPVARRKTVTVIDRDRDWVRITDAAGHEQTVDAWDVIEAVLLDGPEYGEAA